MSQDHTNTNFSSYAFPDLSSSDYGNAPFYDPALWSFYGSQSSLISPDPSYDIGGGVLPSYDYNGLQDLNWNPPIADPYSGYAVQGAEKVSVAAFDPGTAQQHMGDCFLQTTHSHTPPYANVHAYTALDHNYTSPASYQPDLSAQATEIWRSPQPQTEQTLHISDQLATPLSLNSVSASGQDCSNTCTYPLWTEAIKSVHDGTGLTSKQHASALKALLPVEEGVYVGSGLYPSWHPPAGIRILQSAVRKLYTGTSRTPGWILVLTGPPGRMKDWKCEWKENPTGTIPTDMRPLVPDAAGSEWAGRKATQDLDATLSAIDRRGGISKSQKAEASRDARSAARKRERRKERIRAKRG